MSYKTILVGTDGSETAMRAVDEAVAIAARTDAKLVIGVAYRCEPIDDSSGLPRDEMWQISPGSQAEDIVFSGRDRAAKYGVESVGRSLSSETPAAALLDLADEVDADLIVVGNKGMTGARRFLLGSVPNYITHHAKCDVLIARTVD